MHDGMPYGRIEGQGQGHEPFKVWIPSIFNIYLLRHLQRQAYLFIDSGKLGMFQRQICVASVPYEKVTSKRDMLISVLSYVSVDGCAI